MKARLQHACHWMHDEALLAGHWCDAHLVHDRRFWIALAIIVVAIAAMVLLFNLSAGPAVPLDLRPYSHPYYPHWY